MRWRVALELATMSSQTAVISLSERPASCPPAPTTDAQWQTKHHRSLPHPSHQPIHSTLSVNSNFVLAFPCPCLNKLTKLTSI